MDRTQLKYGATFRLHRDWDEHSEGDALELVFDDGTDNLMFKRVSDGLKQWTPLDYVDVIAQHTIDDITTLSVGTVLRDENGKHRRVLGICGEVILFSQAADSVDHDEAHSFRFGHAVRQMKQRGWMVQDDEPVKTMTRAEAEKQLSARIEG